MVKAESNPPEPARMRRPRRRRRRRRSRVHVHGKYTGIVRRRGQSSQVKSSSSNVE